MNKILLTILFFSAVSGSAQNDAVLRAMKDEVNRTVSRLKLENFDRPYFASCYVSDSSETYVSASFGDIKEKNFSFRRNGRMEVRVGNSKFDSSNYISNFRDYKPVYRSLPLSDDYDAVRKSLWLMADEAYKTAVERYSQKDAYRKKKDIKDIYGDLTEERPEVYYEKLSSCGEINLPHYEAWVKRLSLLFRKYPNVQDSDVNIRFSSIGKRFVNSEGSSYVTFSCEAAIYVYARMQNEDGYKIADSKDFLYASWKDINEQEVEKSIEDYALALNAAYKAEKVDYYVGPAIFEKEAAAEFLNQLFVRNISFNPKPWAEKDEWLKYYYEIPKLTERLGKRVLPGFISVYDDPLVKSFNGVSLLGYYPIDSEAVKPQKLDLVKKGRLEAIYSSRIPWENYKKSNGHGRSPYNFFSYASAGNVFFSSEKKFSEKELNERLTAIGKEQELDYVLVISKISSYKNSDKMMGEPVLAYKLDLKTGKRTPLNLSQFDGIGLRALRDIEAASDKDIVYNFYQGDPYSYANSSVPTSIICPSALLIREIELKKTEEKPEKKPYLDHPFFGKH
ncbi:MAG: hypothetical protein Fur0012_04860 [Elusimicrobiota bacterium]